MLVFSRSKRRQRCRDCVKQLASGELVVRLRSERFGTRVESIPWRDFWAPAMPFLGRDARLAQEAGHPQHTSAVVIEDVDLRPGHLRAHRDLFGLGGTAAVHLSGDGFKTQAEHYIVTKPAIAGRLHGDRLW